MNISPAIAEAMKATNAIFTSEVVPSRDMSGLDRVYTRDARIMPPGFPLIAGLDAIKAFWASAIPGLDCVSATLETVDAWTAGELVNEIGKAVLTLGNGQKVEVKYIVI